MPLSEAILEEALRVLREKFHHAPDQLAETERQLRIVGRIVTSTEQVDLIADDPSDERILECAVAAGADIILGGDRHVLALGAFRGIPIRRVAEFLDDLPPRPSSEP